MSALSFLVGAPSSGAGKTTITLGLLRALRRRGVGVSSAKAGPDYIDPAFHAAASGAPCVNLDPFAMRGDLLRDLAGRGRQGLIVEGMMGLFDGAADGSGSAADLAALLSLPAVLVVDCARQSHSVAALVRGFATHRDDIAVAGLILNRVASPRHERLLREALAPLGLPILGALPPRADLALPERHLGLVQAGEHAGLDDFLERAADWIDAGIDLSALPSGSRPQASAAAVPLAPLGQRIAVARDEAFAFAYPHLLDGWRTAGADISFFSPLADEAPDAEADAVYLPGGYPELHAGRLSGAAKFHAGMKAAAGRDALIYGECGGYMMLGESLEDGEGRMHAMLGLLPLQTSFRTRQRHLGYRRMRPLGDLPWTQDLVGHEFHYATIVSEGDADRLFEAEDAIGTELGALGLRVGRTMGSFCHVIDRVT